MYVYFSMTENQLLALTRQYGSIAETLKSMPGVQLQLSDGSTYDQTGRVESISGVIDTSTGSVSLRAAFPNPNGLLHRCGQHHPAEHLQGLHRRSAGRDVRTPEQSICI